MKKLLRNLVIGIIIAIVVSIFVQGISKLSTQYTYKAHLRNEQKTYDTLQIDYNDVLGNNFIHNLPYFSLDLPPNLSLIKILDSNGIVGYAGENENIVGQVQIIDTYSLMDMKSQNTDRSIFDYNMYSKATMNTAYDGLIESTIAFSPYGDVINVEHSVKKISDKVFIYIKYEIPNNDENIIRESYNFLVNGYAIAVVGFYTKNDRIAGSSVDNFLKSIKF